MTLYMPPSELLLVFVFKFLIFFCIRFFCISFLYLYLYSYLFFFVLLFCICILFVFVFYLYSYLFLYYYWGDRACEASSASISALIDSFVERKTTSVLLLPVQISSFQYIMYTVYTSIKLTKARTDNGTPDVELKIHQQTNRYSPPLQTRTFNKYTYTNIRTCKKVHTNLSR